MNSKKVRLALGILLTITLISLALYYYIFQDKKKIPKRKQIILISVDTLRGDHLSSYGYFRDTSPNLSALINDSAYYKQAYANGCWTVPSHMSLITGTLPSRHGVNTHWEADPQATYPKLNDKLKTLPEILKAQHIQTIKFVLLPGELGFDKGFDKNNLYDPLFTDQVITNVLQEIEDNKNKDFFLFVHTWMVHAPYSKDHFLEKGKINDEKSHYINNFRRLSPAKDNLTIDFQGYLQRNHLFNRDDCMALYDSGIYYVDQHIGRIVNKTKQLGIYEEMMFIVVSDHGEHFDEHYPNNFYSFHGADIFEEFIKVPIIIKHPFEYISGTFQHPVSLVDVFPTILDFYDIEIPDFVQGESLLKPYPERKKQYIICEAVSEGGKEKKMIRLGNLKYIISMAQVGTTNRERANWQAITQRRLFDLKSDPQEKNNLYPDLKYRKICMELEKKLVKVIKNSAQLNFQVQETTISKETMKQLQTLGYL